MVGYTVYQKKLEEPEWLKMLLKIRFFGPCDEHMDIRKNEMNVFCIDCNLSICHHCLSSHSRHNLLQIRRYVYNDVIRLHDLQKHLDCSRVQPYTINGAKVVFLNPRPQTKPSTKSNGGGFCKICERNLTDAHCYCSIACKISDVNVSARNRSRGDSFPTLDLKCKANQIPDSKSEESTISSVDLKSEESSVSSVENVSDSALKPKRQLHKRKGVPRRAPVF
ncbi:PLATZ transcription factor family protein [Tasmannia lanceolata]|uniref:PLATZ transcription factor family protein n=1 Tax=Tasmannia lanceolata TaxID=3420 RepID=UPI00406381A6